MRKEIPDQEFIEVNSPWPVQFTIDIDNLAANTNTADMVAVKMGDVNDTYTSFAGNSVDVRSGHSVILNVTNEELLATSNARIDIWSDTNLHTQGLQLTIEVKDISVDAIESSLIGFGKSNYSIDGNLISISWSGNTMQNINEGQALFTLLGKVHSDANTADAISISDRKLRSEIYLGESLEINEVELKVRDESGDVVVSENVLLFNGIYF